MFDVEKHTFTLAAEMTVPRCNPHEHLSGVSLFGWSQNVLRTGGLSCASTDEKIYAVGGRPNAGGDFMNTMEVYDRVAKRWTLHHARINHRRGFFGMGIIKGTVADESAAVVHKPGWECDTASLFSRVAHAKTVCRSTDPHWQQYGIPGGCSAQCATAFRAVVQGEGCEAAVQNLVRIPRLPSRLQLLTGDPCVL